MRILSTFLFAFVCLGVALAQEEKVPKSNNFSWETEEGGLYIAFDWGVRPSLSSFGESEGEFSIKSDSAVRAGTVPLTPRKDFGDMAFGVGFQRPLGKRIYVRYEGGLKWHGLVYGKPTYTSFDFAPIPLEEVNRLVTVTDGTMQMVGPQGDLFFDFELSDTQNFIYVGSGIGYVKGTSQYKLSIGEFTAGMDDTDWVRVNSFELGALFRLGERTRFRTAYHFNKFNNFKLTTNSGSMLDLALNNQHSFKIGIVHFFRKM